MSIAWEGCPDSTEQELDRVLARLDGPILARSGETEARYQREMRQIDTAMACVYVLVALAIASILVWCGGAIGSAIDSLGKVAR